MAMIVVMVSGRPVPAAVLPVVFCFLGQSSASILQMQELLPHSPNPFAVAATLILCQQPV